MSAYHPMMARTPAWLLIAILAGCSSEHTSPPPPAATVTKVVGDQLDVLLVVNNTLQMQGQQDLLAQSLPSFVQALDAFPGGRPDLHLGVVTSTVGTGTTAAGNCPIDAPDDDGLMVNMPRVMTGCSGPTGRYITDHANSTGGRSVNYSGTLAQAMTCIADVGTSGCGIDQPLEAMTRAFDGSRPENAGFVRPDGHLAVIFVGDEDDHSVGDPSAWGLSDLDQLQWLYAYTCDQPISPDMPGTYTGCHERDDSYLRPTASYVSFLSTIQDPGQLVVATIAGDPAASSIQIAANPQPSSNMLGLAASCSTTGSTPGTAWPGIRMAAFATAFGDHAVVRTPCATDYGPAIADIAARIQRVMGPCLDGAIDTTDRDASTPGVQLGCTATANGATLPACAMTDATTPDPASPTPCVWYAADTTCGAAPGLAVHVVGGTGAPLRVTCPLAK